MIDDVLRGDAERWNAAQEPAPDLYAAIDNLDRGRGTPRSRRMMLSGLAAASVVAAAAAVVVISTYGGQSRQAAQPASGGTGSGVAPVITKTVVDRITVTQTASVTVVRTRIDHVDSTANVTSDLMLTVTVPVPVTARTGAVAGTTAAGTAATNTADADGPLATFAATKPRPVVGHTRALLASIGFFIAIAGAWGIGLAQRRRSH